MRADTILLTLTPLQGVPSTADKFLNLVEEVDRIRQHQQASAPYILVHCSAGIGRTGVLILTLAMLDKLRHKVRITRTLARDPRGHRMEST